MEPSCDAAPAPSTSTMNSRRFFAPTLSSAQECARVFLNENPPERAAALERSAGDACAIPKTLDQFSTPMVDDSTYAARMGAAYVHLRGYRGGADHRKATGSRDMARAVRIHADRACPTRYVPPAPQAQKRGSPSLALDAALVHTS